MKNQAFFKQKESFFWKTKLFQNKCQFSFLANKFFFQPPNRPLYIHRKIFCCVLNFGFRRKTLVFLFCYIIIAKLIKNQAFWNWCWRPWFGAGNPAPLFEIEIWVERTPKLNAFWGIKVCFWKTQLFEKTMKVFFWKNQAFWKKWKLFFEKPRFFKKNESFFLN